jgi:glycosyltransferase involved in cell wall biosynthesis
MLKVTAVIPARNEADRIAGTLEKVKPFVDEIIVIDDASEDQTVDIAEHHEATVLTHSEKRGYIDAIKYGFKNASGQIIITLDADGEFSPEYIPDLIKPIVDGCADMVQGHRNAIPRPSEIFLTWLAMRKAEVGDSGTGMRAIRADLAKSLEIKGACICGVLSLEAISKGGRIIDVPITLQKINKPRKIAWFHIRQLFYIIPWMFKKLDKPTVS